MSGAITIGTVTGFGPHWLLRQQAGEPGDVVTFYSYKGGTGRSMALVNCAGLLAQALPSEARPLLLLDFDLEAPGLHRYLAPYLPADAAERPGVLELFETLREAVQARLPAADGNERPHLDDEEASAIVDACDLAPYLIETGLAGLRLIQAGRFDDSYDRRLLRFDWEGLYASAPGLFRALAHRLSGDYSYTLIDSRTGLSDTSGLCTMLLPDVLVMVFTPNTQSLTGIDHLLRRAAGYRENAADGRPLRVYPLPSRVDNQVEHFRQVWRMGDSQHPLFGAVTGYQPMFEAVFASTLGAADASLQAYFDVVQVPHSADYAYGERLCFGDGASTDSLSIRSSYEQLLPWLATGARPWERPADLLLNQQADAWLREAGADEPPDSPDGWPAWFERLATVASNPQHAARLQFRQLAPDRQTGVGLMLALAHAVRGEFAVATEWLQQAQEGFAEDAETAVAADAPTALLRWWTDRLDPAEPPSRDRQEWVLQMARWMERWQPQRGARLAWLDALQQFAARSLWTEVERDALQALVALCAEAFGEDDERGLAAMNRLGLALLAQGRYAEARDWQQRLLDTRRRLQGDDDPRTLAAGGNLAATELKLGDIAGGRARLEAVLAAQRRVLGDAHADTATSMSHYANLLVGEGRYGEAEVLLRQVLANRQQHHGAAHAETLMAGGNLASVMRAQGRLDEALALERSVEETARGALGELHPVRLAALGNLAATLAQQGRLAEARAAQEQVVDASTRSLGADHPSTLTATDNLAGTLLRLGDPSAAMRLQQRTLEAQMRTLGEDHPDVLVSLGNFAETLRAVGDLDRAAELQRHVLDARRARLGAAHPHTLQANDALALTMAMSHRPEQAEALLREALAATRETAAAHEPPTFLRMKHLASTLHAQGREDEAVALLREALDGCLQHLGEQHPRTLSTMNDLAGLLKAREGGHEEAIALQRRVLELATALHGPAHADTLTAMGNLASTLWEQGATAEARTLQQHVYEQLIGTLPADSPEIWSAGMSLATTMLDDGDSALAALILDSFSAPDQSTDNAQWLGLRLRIAERLGQRSEMLRLQRRLSELLRTPNPRPSPS